MLNSSFAGTPVLDRPSAGAASVASQSSGAGSALDVGLLRRGSPSAAQQAGGSSESGGEEAPRPRLPLKRRLWQWTLRFFLKPVFG